ncbi:MAG: recombinase XerD, partial [Exilibacterium sp.]
TQKTALNAIVFLYRNVLMTPLGELAHSYAKKSVRIPTVFTLEEAYCIINKLKGRARNNFRPLYQ